MKTQKPCEFKSGLMKSRGSESNAKSHLIPSTVLFALNRGGYVSNRAQRDKCSFMDDECSKVNPQRRACIPLGQCSIIGARV